MKKIKFEIEINIEDQHIDDLMVTALEGGINYWCRQVRVIKFPEGIDDIIASDVISKGGELKLWDAEDDEETWILTLEMFLEGIKMYCIANGETNMDDLMDNHDACTADQIMQYALFKEIVFG